jgi:hypothetical protein
VDGDPALRSASSEAIGGLAYISGSSCLTSQTKVLVDHIVSHPKDELAVRFTSVDLRRPWLIAIVMSMVHAMSQEILNMYFASWRGRGWLRRCF